MSQLIDLAAAKEFMSETLNRVTRDDLTAMAADLEAKSRLFQRHLLAENISGMTDKGLEEILGSVFATRRRRKQIQEALPLEAFQSGIHNLLYGTQSTEQRFQTFVNELGDLDTSVKTDLAGEILHFTYPDKYWLWSRWMWDPKKKTGAIALVTTEGFDLLGETEGEVYLKVGNGVAFTHSIAEAAGFQFISRTLFGTDVFLSCVYVVYAYTVLRMRMTQEFNKVMPGLPEFSRRLLGIFNLPQAA